MNLIDYIGRPWPWWVAGPSTGPESVPLLLLAGNKRLGVSSSLRHICAALIPAGIPFFKYDWKKEAWNLFFAAGIFAGGLVAVSLLKNPEPIQVNPNLLASLNNSKVFMTFPPCSPPICSVGVRSLPRGPGYCLSAAVSW
jgi:hypothetical protein